MLHKTIIRFESGIYKITNLTNQKFYIGSSVNIYNRFHTHSTKLKKNVHSSRHLQASYNKYGKDNFIFEVIEYCQKELCVEREQYYLDTLKPQYNKRTDATLNLGVKNSKETREKISKGLKLAFLEGRRECKCVNGVPVVLFDLEGNELLEFASAGLCAAFLQICRNAPLRAIKSRTRVIKGGKYIILKKSEKDQIKNFIKIPKKIYKKNVKVLDLLLNTETIYNTFIEARVILRYKKSDSLIRAAKNNVILKNRYKIFYYGS
jgi:hypothetical protein